MVFGVYRFTDLAAIGISIKFNACVGLVLASLALLSLSYLPAYRLISSILGGSAAIIALTTLCQGLAGVDLGVDTLFFDEAPGLPGTSAPGRMGLPASVSIAMLGAAIVCAAYPKAKRHAALLAILAFAIAAFALSGYAFGATRFYADPDTTAIALQAAIMVAILALGVAAAVPDHGLAGIFTRGDAGAVMIWRSLLPLIAITLLMRYVVRLGLANGYYDREMAAAVVTLTEILIFTGLMWWTAQKVSDAEAKSVEAHRVLAENQMLARLAETQKAERERLAGDLHDQIGQQVTGLRLQLQALCERPACDDSVLDEIGLVCEKLKKLDGEISVLAWQLRPAPLEADGLVASLRNFGSEWSANHRIAFDFHASSTAVGLSQEAEDNLYRITQEALNNVLKHAEATRVGMTLNFNGGEVLLTIEDDGRGFKFGEERNNNGTGGFGLVGMQERAGRIGGNVEIESTPGAGTTIFVRVPATEGGGNAHSSPFRGMG